MGYVAHDWNAKPSSPTVPYGTVTSQSMPANGNDNNSPPTAVSNLSTDGIIFAPVKRVICICCLTHFPLRCLLVHLQQR